MGNYSIKDLEQISGIKAHTIRVWEKRYKLIDPKRTSTNIRYYSEGDLRRLLNISILNSHGYKISAIAEMDEADISKRVMDLSLDGTSNDGQIDNYIAAMLELNELKFLNMLSGSIMKLGFERSVEKILLPFIERVYNLWQTGSVLAAQKNFVHNLIRQKITVAIENEMQNPVPFGMRVIMFLPRHENFEIELLFYDLLARKEKLEVIYLGPSVELNDLRILNNSKKADFFMTSFSSPQSDEQINMLMVEYKEMFPSTPFFIAGRQVRDQKLIFPEDFSTIKDINDFKQAVQLIKYSE